MARENKGFALFSERSGEPRFSIRSPLLYPIELRALMSYGRMAYAEGRFHCLGRGIYYAVHPK